MLVTVKRVLWWDVLVFRDEHDEQVVAEEEIGLMWGWVTVLLPPPR